MQKMFSWDDVIMQDKMVDMMTFILWCISPYQIYPSQMQQPSPIVLHSKWSIFDETDLGSGGIDDMITSHWCL